jgi:outer membrane protein assembly factor BamD (BamD/ComL family)
MRSLYLAGQSAAVVDPPKAKALFGELVEEFPKSSFADDALFFAADVAAKNLADPKGAQQDLETLVEHYPDGDYAQEARFRLFWLARLA